jgi:hypothetical protein
MRRAAKIDANQTEIVDAFRKLGASVQSLAALGKGVPDIMVSLGGITWLVEIKAGRSKENPLQTAWASSWLGCRAVVRDLEGVIVTVKTMAAQSKQLRGAL